jgi:hypothetical protein
MQRIQKLPDPLTVIIYASTGIGTRCRGPQKGRVQIPILERHPQRVIDRTSIRAGIFELLQPQRQWQQIQSSGVGSAVRWLFITIG